MRSELRPRVEARTGEGRDTNASHRKDPSLQHDRIPTDMRRPLEDPVCRRRKMRREPLQVTINHGAFWVLCGGTPVNRLHADEDHTRHVAKAQTSAHKALDADDCGPRNPLWDLQT